MNHSSVLNKAFLFSAALLTLSACATPIDRTKLKYNSEYWQRADVSSAIYTRGPKAQQMLNRDISRCVTEIHELERLGALRHAVPANTDAPDNTPQNMLDRWETPQRDAYLRAEHLPYHDFESCMVYRGWERIKHVPYGVAERARNTYLEVVEGENYRTKYDMDDQYLRTQDDGEYSDLNE